MIPLIVILVIVAVALYFMGPPSLDSRVRNALWFLIVVALLLLILREFGLI